MKQALLALVLLLVTALNSPCGEADDLMPARRGGDAEKIALSGKPLIAASAFGMWLEAVKQVENAEVKVMQRFCRKQFDKGVFLISVHGLAKQAVPGLIPLKEQRLAAALLATDACMSHQYAEYQAGLVRAAMLNEAGEEVEGRKNKKKGKGKGRKGKGKGKKNLGGGVQGVPAELFATRDAETTEFAILAAAYSKSAELADAVKNVKAKSAGIQGAQLLYSALLNNEMTLTSKVYKDLSRQRKAITSLSPSLITFTAKAPPLCYAMQGIAACGDEAHLSYAHQALQYRDVRVRVDAAKAIAKIASKTSLKTVLEDLERAEWPVLIHLCKYLARCPDKSSIEPLIKFLDGETGRFRCDAVFALSAIAGQTVGGTAADWRAWWKTNKKSFEVDEEASKKFLETGQVQAMPVPGFGTFYAIPIVSDHLCFVVDSSLSMKGDRIASLKQTLSGITENFPKTPTIHFNIIDFGGDIEYLDKRKLTTQASRAKSHIYDMDMSLMTRSFDAMERAALLEGGLDSIYFLSDGAPTPSQLRTWNAIAEGLFMMNRYRRLAVCMVSFDPKKENAFGMLAVANENVGLYEATDVGPAAAEDGDDGDKKKKGKKGKKKK